MFFRVLFLVLFFLFFIILELPRIISSFSLQSQPYADDSYIFTSFSKYELSFTFSEIFFCIGEIISCSNSSSSILQNLVLYILLNPFFSLLKQMAGNGIKHGEQSK